MQEIVISIEPIAPMKIYKIVDINSSKLSFRGFCTAQNRYQQINALFEVYFFNIRFQTLESVLSCS